MALINSNLTGRSNNVPLTTRSLSIIVACYRDAGSVREMYRRLSEIIPTITNNFELIFVNDASPDDCEEILSKLAANDPRLVIINHTRNFGSQNAFLSGMKAARGDGVVLMDGDLQDPPEIIPQFISHWLKGFHIVYGTRVKRKETLFRQVAYKAFYRLFKVLTPFNVPLDAGDFGLLDKRVVETLLNDFPERVSFLRGLRAYTGYKHCGVDYIRQERFDGVSTNSLLGNIRWAKLAIFSFSQKPLGYISLMASLTVLLTLAAIAYYLLVFVISFASGISGPPPGYMTLLIIILILGAVNSVSLAILSEYMGHIYNEVKGRPRYIVRDIIDNRITIQNQTDKTVGNSK